MHEYNASYRDQTNYGSEKDGKPLEVLASLT